MITDKPVQILGTALFSHPTQVKTYHIMILVLKGVPPILSAQKVLWDQIKYLKNSMIELVKLVAQLVYLN